MSSCGRCKNLDVNHYDSFVICDDNKKCLQFGFGNGNDTMIPTRNILFENIHMVQDTDEYCVKIPLRCGCTFSWSSSLENMEALGLYIRNHSKHIGSDVKYDVENDTVYIGNHEWKMERPWFVKYGYKNIAFVDKQVDFGINIVHIPSSDDDFARFICDRPNELLNNLKKMYEKIKRITWQNNKYANTIIGEFYNPSHDRMDFHVIQTDKHITSVIRESSTTEQQTYYMITIITLTSQMSYFFKSKFVSNCFYTMITENLKGVHDIKKLKYEKYDMEK